MTAEGDLRRRIGTARRVVVKIGSSAITSFHGGIRRQSSTRSPRCQSRMTAGSDVFVVSSGAIGACMALLRMTARPTTLSAKQPAASVGQPELARGGSLARYDRVVGRVLPRPPTSAAGTAPPTPSGRSIACGHCTRSR